MKTNTLNERLATEEDLSVNGDSELGFTPIPSKYNAFSKQLNQTKNGQHQLRNKHVSPSKLNHQLDCAEPNQELIELCAVCQVTNQSLSFNKLMTGQVMLYS